MDLIHQLNWRYVIKRSGGSMSSEKLDRITETIRSSAGTFGLQANTVMPVDKGIRLDRIFQLIHPQAQTATHLIVFTAWTSIKRENINELIAHIAASKGLSLDNSGDYKTTMKLLVSNSCDDNLSWCVKQAYMAMGTGLAAARDMNVEAIPIEEFDRKKVDSILQLDAKGLGSVVMLALGRTDEKDGDHAHQARTPAKREPHLFEVN
jgi:nitroreductase/dihydropteridine reductase